MVLNIRFCRESDLVQIAGIEGESYEHPWPIKDVARVSRLPHVMVLVVEDMTSGDLIGYVFVECSVHWMSVINMAVDVPWRRMGVGTVLIANLVSIAKESPAPMLLALIRETNLPAHLFFRSADFIAVETVRGVYLNSDEDSYRFQRILEPSPPVLHRFGERSSKIARLF